MFVSLWVSTSEICSRATPALRFVRFQIELVLLFVILSILEEVIQYIAGFEGKEANIIHLGGSENLSKHERVGHSLIALGYYGVSRNLLSYIDYEKLGKDFLFNSSGDVIGDYFIEINWGRESSRWDDSYMACYRKYRKGNQIKYIVDYK